MDKTATRGREIETGTCSLQYYYFLVLFMVCDTFYCLYVPNEMMLSLLRAVLHATHRSGCRCLEGCLFGPRWWLVVREAPPDSASGIQGGLIAFAHFFV